MMRADDRLRAGIPRRVSTVVLTGGRFSVDAGLPITGELVSRGRQRMTTPLGPEFLDSLDGLSHRVLHERLGDEIEAVLTRLKVLEYYSARYKTDVRGSVEEHNYVTELLPLESGIYLVMWAALNLPSDPPSLYDEFLRHLGEEVAFTSLNYDMLLETIFRRNQRHWYYPLQGETRFHNELSSYDGSFHTPFEEDPYSIPYLKLHGSFNWYACWRCEYFHITREVGTHLYYIQFREGRAPLWIGEPFWCNEEECRGRGGPESRQAVLNPLVIPPTRIKAYSRAPIRRSWAYFDLLLREAEEVLLVGTSIRDEDVLLHNALNCLRYKNPGLKRVVVINPEKAIRRKVSALTELTAKDIHWCKDLATYLRNG